MLKEMQQPSAIPSGKQKVKLSCERCQQRKVKCDKNSPCGACRRAGLDCTAVHRQRLPRGRNVTRAGKEADLKDRVARLEKLLSRGGSGLGSQYSLSETPSKNTEDDEKVMSADDGNPMWMALNDQVTGIRNILEDEFSDNESETSFQDSLPSSQQFDIILFGTCSCTVNPSIIEPPTRTIVYALLDIYLDRIDRVFKVTHAPTLCNILAEDDLGRTNSPSSPAVEALRFAVYFTAICAQDDTECWHMFQKDKKIVVDKFRLATEVMLSRASLQTTKNLTVLQAFTIYLAGRRTCSDHMRISTLVASAIRIGQSLGLDTQDKCAKNPFELESRRRLWFAIGILDMQAAFDVGSHAAITQNDLLGCPPMRINDREISPVLQRPPFESTGLTDMSFSSMTYDALICWRKLTYVPTDREGHTIQTNQEWAVRSKIVKDMEQNLIERYLQYCDTAQPFQLYTKLVGEGIIVTMRLLERRPLHPFLSRGSPPKDDFDVLRVATEVLEGGLAKSTNQSLAPWSWFTWAKWCALAVLLAELCGQPHGSQTNRAWAAAEASFVFFENASPPIDEELWKSIKKLMVRARGAREGLPIPLTILSPGAQYGAASSINNASTAKLGDSSSASSTNRRIQQGAKDWTPPRNNGRGPFDGFSQTLHSLPELEFNNLPQDTWTNEPEAMSSINWDLFVQDIFDTGEPSGLDSMIWSAA